MDELVELLGFGFMAVAAFLVSVALGWLVMGLLLVFVAQGLDVTRARTAAARNWTSTAAAWRARRRAQ